MHLSQASTKDRRNQETQEALRSSARRTLNFGASAKLLDEVALDTDSEAEEVDKVTPGRHDNKLLMPTTLNPNA